MTDPGGDPAVDPSAVRPCHLLWTGDLPVLGPPSALVATRHEWLLRKVGEQPSAYVNVLLEHVDPEAGLELLLPPTKKQQVYFRGLDLVRQVFAELLLASPISVNVRRNHCPLDGIRDLVIKLCHSLEPGRATRDNRTTSVAKSNKQLPYRSTAARAITSSISIGG